MRSINTVLRVAALAFSITLVAAGCSSETSDAPEKNTPTIETTDMWIKAGDGEMSSAFGTISNSTDEDLNVVAASSDAAETVELHEIIEKDGRSLMQEKEGGFIVPAGSELELSPGGDHLMLMGMKQPVEPGDEVTFTIEMADGSTHEFVAVAKEFVGANEDYGSHGEDKHDEHAGEDHADHDHGSESDHGDHDHGDADTGGQDN